MTKALIIVDLQNDFCPGGALAVPDGDAILKPLEQILHLFPLIVTTQDWHPPQHTSFQAQGGPWPDHCVQGTHGAERHPDLNLEGYPMLTIKKGTEESSDAYSGFQGTFLATRLKERHIQEVFIVGLATDYCVKATALDALREGFGVTVFEDLVRAVNVKPGDGEQALEVMRRAGCSVIRSSDSLEAQKGQGLEGKRSL